MSILRVLMWLGATLLAVLVAVVLYLSFADLNWLKPRIEAAVAEQTGRELKLGGAFDLDIVPSPAILVEDVSLSNAGWGSEPMLVTVGHFSARVGFWSLLSGPVRIESLRLRDIDVLLEKNEQEQGNWEMGAASDSEASEEDEPDSGGSASAGVPVIVEFAEVRNVKLIYREPQAEAQVVALESLDIKGDENKYTVIDATGKVDDQPFRLAARMGSEDALVSGDGISIELAPEYGDYSVKANGVLNAGADAFGLQHWVVKYLDTETRIDGTIGRAADSGIRLAIDSSGPSMKSLDAGLPAIPFKAALVAILAGEDLTLDSIDTSFGKSDLSGSVDIKGGDKPVVKGKLRSSRLDLTPFAAGEEDSEEKPAAKDGKAEPESKYVFVEEPLPFEALNSVILDMKSRVDKLTFENVVLTDVDTGVELKDGKLHYTNRFKSAEGGRSASDIMLATAGKSAKLYVDVKMRDLRINLLSGENANKAQIPPVSVTLDIKSTGGSPRQLAASSYGRVLVTQGKGKIVNDLMDTFSGDVIAQLFSALNPFATKEKYTTLDCLILGLEMKNGKTDITGMLFETTQVKALGEGDIDLNTEALNMKFNTEPRAGVGVSSDMFVTPFIKLTGTLAHPAIGLDKKGAVVAGGAAILTGGLSVLAKGAADRAAGEKDSCAETLEAVGKHPPIKK